MSGRAAVSLEKPGRVGRASSEWRLTREMQRMRLELQTLGSWQQGPDLWVLLGCAV